MTSAYSSSTATASPASSADAAMATICWARTSSALRGTTVGSMRALAHEARDDRALEQVGAELREDAALARVADVVPGAADALQAAGDGLRRLDLQDEVDGAHVDAQLERGRRDQARQLAGLQQLLDDRALLARERAVVGAGDLDGRRVLGAVGVGQLVEAQGQPLGAAAGVDEDDRRAVLADEPQDLGVDRRPDRPARRLAADERIEAGRGRRCSARARPSTRPARGSAGPAACGSRRRRPAPAGAGRPGSARPPRAGSASRSGRCAADVAAGPPAGR